MIKNTRCYIIKISYIKCKIRVDPSIGKTLFLNAIWWSLVSLRDRGTNDHVSEYETE